MEYVSVDKQTGEGGLMKWTISLSPKDPHLEVNHVTAMRENPKSEQNKYFADYIRKLADRNKWSEVTGKFRNFKEGTRNIAIELDCLNEP